MQIYFPLKRLMPRHVLIFLVPVGSCRKGSGTIKFHIFLWLEIKTKKKIVGTDDDSVLTFFLSYAM